VRDVAEKEATELFGPVKKPTYTTAMDEVLEHDETSLETDDDKAAWAKYLEVQEKHTAHIGTKMMRFFLYHGVKVDPNVDDKWEAEQKFFGIEIPTDPIERRLHYVQTQLIFSQDDIQQITMRLMTLAGVRPEVVDAAVNSFRN